MNDGRAGGETWLGLAANASTAIIIRVIYENGSKDSKHKAAIAMHPRRQPTNTVSTNSIPPTGTAVHTDSAVTMF